MKWTSGNKQIDDFIQRRQLETNYKDDLLFEWISYDRFNDVKELGKSDLITVYSAVWEDGPLYWNKIEWIRSDKQVILKCFLQNDIDELLNEV